MKIKGVKITARGVVLALKNVGVYLLSVGATNLRANPLDFLFGFAVFCLINVPSDLFLMNKWENDKKDAMPKEG